ncbi:MAG: response regulator transcription factor [Thermomicrobiales bacterium]|nr:response regulator transcription factor [Thermomicrobiales bacterium]
MFSISEHAVREEKASVRCATAPASSHRPVRTPSLPTLWNQWANLDRREPPLADGQGLARAATEAQRELLAATEAAEAALTRARDLSQQLTTALEALRAAEAHRTQRPDTGQPGRWARLSPREREVLALVAQGHSNKAIADALYVSPNTVKTHVAALLNKLEVDTRVQLAALAVRHADRPEAA